MSDQTILRLEETPTAKEYIELRRILGWGEITHGVAQQTLSSATFTLCLRDKEKLAGLLRIVGDGVLYLFIADVMVHPAYAGRGLGNELMEAAVSYIDRVADPWATVTLIPR